MSKDFEFEFNERAFQKEIQRQAQFAVDQYAKQYSTQMAALSSRYTGSPISEIKPELRRIFADNGGSISDPELTEYAQMISNGTQIEFKSESIQWK